MVNLRPRTVFVNGEPMTFRLRQVLGVQIEARIPFFRLGDKILLEREGAPDLQVLRETKVLIKGGERFYTLPPCTGG